jgi:hypothetical protein
MRNALMQNGQNAKPFHEIEVIRREGDVRLPVVLACIFEFFFNSAAIMAIA